MGVLERELVSEALSSNWIAPSGPFIKQFEHDLSKILQVNHCLSLASGSAALHLALSLVNTETNDLVISQAHTFVSPINAISYLKAKPILIDSEPQTWNMDPNILEYALKRLERQGNLKRVKAILPVHMYGMPAAIEEILSIANRFEIPVIEDAAESLGSLHNNKPLGSFGLLGAISFNGNKIITTSSGGALCSNNPQLIAKARFLASQSKDPALHYEHSELGYNYQMSNILASLGVAQLKVLDNRIEKRRANFDFYYELFRNINKLGYEIEFQNEAQQSKSNRWLTCITFKPEKNNGIRPKHLINALEKANIESRPIYKPMHLQPLYKDELYLGGSFSESLFNNGLCLPSGSSLENEDLERIKNVVCNLFG